MQRAPPIFGRHFLFPRQRVRIVNPVDRLSIGRYYASQIICTRVRLVRPRIQFNRCLVSSYDIKQKARRSRIPELQRRIICNCQNTDGIHRNLIKIVSTQRVPVNPRVFSVVVGRNLIHHYASEKTDFTSKTESPKPRTIPLFEATSCAIISVPSVISRSAR